MEDEKTNKTIVLDNGSGMIKAGWSGDSMPTFAIPSIVGEPRVPHIMINAPRTQKYVGYNAQTHRGILNLEYPLENGIVTNWDNMILLWNHVFEDKLCVKSEDANLLVTEAPLNPKANKEKMAEVFFETFKVGSIYIGVQAVLSLYANGTTTGLVFDSGDGVSHTVPVYEGYFIPHAITRSNVAGRTLTAYMAKLLSDNGINVTISGSLEIAREIKEDSCFIVLDHNEAHRNIDQHGSNDLIQPYTLPDGTLIHIGLPRIDCPEALFQPNLVGEESQGIHKQIYNTITKCDVDIRKSMYNNIVLSGGTTLFPGILERLQIELKNLSKVSDLKIIAQPERKYLVWVGGSVLSELPTFKELSASRSEYEEIGSSVVYRKFY